MFVMIENGALTEGSVERLTELIETQVGSDPNYSKIVILEAENGENEDFAGQIVNAKMSMYEPRNQKTDEMFQNYDANNQDKVRQAFRLPPLMIGRSQDYNRSTASASLKMADEQIFGPEREVVDSQMNRIMLDQGIRWHFFKSRTPNITDNEVLSRAMVSAERSGAMTPRRADTLMQDIFEGELGPMPEGIDLDQPYSLTFALAQNAQVVAPSEMSEGQVGTVERSEDWVSQYIDEILAGIDKQDHDDFHRFVK
jgi:capsid portal protein